MTAAVRTVAILTAAGSGSRLGGDRPKALVEIGGVTVVEHAARALVASSLLDRLVVTAPASAQGHVAHVLQMADLAVPLDVVTGGASRQASVAAGLRALEALSSPPLLDDDVVLVHDAARPFVSAELVRRVALAVTVHGAVVPGLPLADTVKQVDEELRVTGTPDRRRLRAVQTPQGFTVGLLRRAHEDALQRAAEEGTAATDDAALVEALGGEVWVVEGDESAMKVTTPRDLMLAELWLQAQR